MTKNKGNKPESDNGTPAPAPEGSQLPAVVQPQPSAAMLALFKGTVDLTKAKRLNMPRLLLASEIPVFTPENQAMLVAKIVKATNSPAASVKGKCLWCTMGDGTDRLIPVTGVIRQALCPGVEADSKELMEALTKLAGKTLVLRRLPDGDSAKYKRKVYMFDVYLAD